MQRPQETPGEGKRREAGNVAAVAVSEALDSGDVEFQVHGCG